jgi:capsular polysaccharide biosynthesis protein
LGGIEHGSPAREPRAVALIVFAAVDRPRTGVLRPVPAALEWLQGALVLTVALTAARLAGADGPLIGAAILNHARATPQYEASSSVAFAVSTLTDAALQGQRGSADPLRDAGTNVLIAKSSEVAERARSILKTSTSAADLQKLVSVEAAPTAGRTASAREITV